ncbi:MAG: PD40 domain-containing protein [Flavobacteriales bacterium]|nr:PD40 domain-containing protein [Flavobacteriales bacterium]MCB9365111.1 PD40 domain-containing protein [Flavobacteriales bacterium]
MRLSSILIFLAVLFCSFSIKAQDKKYTSTNKKAIKLYEEGKNAYDMRNNELAELNFLEALEKDPNFAEAELLLAYVYTETGKYEAAIEHYNKSIAIKPDLFPEAHASVGLLELRFGRYEAAQKSLTNYFKFTDSPLMMKDAAKKGLIDCEFAMEALKNPVPFEPKNLGAGINSELPEYFPSLSADGMYLLYTRRLNSEKTYDGFNEDFYISKYDGHNWQQSINLKGINSMNNEGAPTISPNGQFLIFTSCADMNGYGPDRKGYGSCDLFYAYNIGGKWTNPKNLGTPINTQHWETQPSFSSDGKTLYFVRGFRTRNGIKQQDIWTSELSEGGVWSTPSRLSDVINTDGREESVFIHPDNKTLYFSSDGHPGMGGLDLYMSTKNEDGQWTTPVNLGYPINTFNDENSLLVDAEGKLAYFASNREGGYGDLDLYAFELPENARPNRVTYLAGKVYDAETKEVLPARFELINLQNKEVAVQSYADEVTGDYLVCLPVNKDYALNVSQPGYLFHSENFTLTEGTIDKPFKKDVPMHKIKVGQSVVLKNVFFETAKFDLKTRSEIELDKLVDFLNKNEKLKIELSGHTDNIGDTKMNQTLSENRSKAVFDYLVKKGIDTMRLTTKGYGDTQPIATNDTDAGRAENRRTEFKVIAN